MKNVPIFLFIICLIIALITGCNDQPPSIAEVPDEQVAPQTPELNDDNTAIYDVDDEDPYRISNGIFLGLQPGESFVDYQEGLRKGTLKSGAVSLSAWYIDGAEGNELGYVLPDPRDAGTVRSIVITSPDVVTEKGIRVGYEFPELMQRLGTLSLHGSEIESRVYADEGNLRYRLDMASNKPNIKSSEVPAGTKVTEIWIVE